MYQEVILYLNLRGISKRQLVVLYTKRKQTINSILHIKNNDSVELMMANQAKPQRISSRVKNSKF